MFVIYNNLMHLRYFFSKSLNLIFEDLLLNIIRPCWKTMTDLIKLFARLLIVKGPVRVRKWCAACGIG